MARALAFVGGLTCGFALATLVMVSHADDVQAEVSQAAAEAHVDAVQLQGALNSLEYAGKPVDPYTYLRSTGELPSLPSSAPTSPSAPTSGVLSSRVACIVRVESQGDPSAHNRSGASGLGQFLPSTWASTPQGRAGLSVYNPAANRAAIQYMLDSGRASEFDAVRYYGC